MSEKSTPFTRILSAFLIHNADEGDGAPQLVEDLVTAHQMNVEHLPPLAPIEPRRRKHIEDEIKKVNPVAKKKWKGGGGFVDFTQKGSGSHIQTLAEDVDSRVSARMRGSRKSEDEKTRVQKAKALVQEILEEIARRNGWE